MYQYVQSRLRNGLFVGALLESMPPDHKAELGMLQRTQAIAAQFELNKDHLEHISNRFVHILGKVDCKDQIDPTDMV